MDDIYLEVQPSFNFYLSSLEAQTRCELKDGEARLTQSRTEGRVRLEIQEESLVYFLDQLQEQRENKQWSCEREKLKREICSLKEELKQAQAKDVVSDQREEESFKSQLKNLKKSLRNVQDDLKQQTSLTNNFQAQLEQMKTEREVVQNKMEALKIEVHVFKQLRAMAENDMERMAHCLQAKLSNNDAAESEARSKTEKLEGDLQFERAQAQKLQKELSEMEEALLKQKEDARKTKESSQFGSLQVRLMVRDETRKACSTLKEAKDLLEAECLRLQRENSSLQEQMETYRVSCLSELDYQRHKSNELMGALKEAEQKLYSQSMKCQQHKWSFLQATEGLKPTLQEKEQESEKTEGSTGSKLEDPERQISEKCYHQCCSCLGVFNETKRQLADCFFP